MNPVGFDIEQERAYPTPYACSPILPLLLLSLTLDKHSPNTKTSFSSEYDYIVVGAGAAGSTVASRLSEEPCVSVLLLEAGKPSPILTEIPAISRSFVNTDIDWQYLTTPQRYTAAGLINRQVPWPSGKTIGGSSIFSAMLYVRGNRRNYDEWAELGATGWSYEDVLPYFKKLENNTDPKYLENGFHATGGPITASRPTYNSIKKRSTMEAILNEGYSFVDPNAAEQNGFYDYQATMRNGQRCSTAKGYLVPAENRTNLDILPNATVRKVLIENKRATGVEFDYDGSTHQVKARRDVILSAGTTNSAQLLMLSGIGPMSELKKFNIPLVADLPVGLNFQDHPVSFLLFQVNHSVPRFEDDIVNDESVQTYIDNRTGPLTSAEGFNFISHLNNFGNGSEGIPDHSLYLADFSSILLQQESLTPEVQNVFLPFENASLLYCAVQLLHPYSVGTVSLQSADPFDPPVIDPNYFADFRDIHDMVQGMKVCLRIMSNPAMTKINAKPIDVLIPGCEEFAEDVDLYFACIVRTIIVATGHSVGTAKMGNPEDPSTVVDPELRVKGIEGLRVVDASVMPTIPWAKMNIPTIMVAEKASDIIKSKIRCNAE